MPLPAGRDIQGLGQHKRGGKFRLQGSVMTKKTAAVLSGLLVAGAITVRLEPDAATSRVRAGAASPMTSSSVTAASSTERAARGIAQTWPCGAIRSCSSAVDYRSGRPGDRRQRADRLSRVHRHPQSRPREHLPAASADNYIRQGVTTLIEGPDGGSPVPLGPFLDKLEATRNRSTSGRSLARVGTRGRHRPRERRPRRPSSTRCARSSRMA